MARERGEGMEGRNVGSAPEGRRELNGQQQIQVRGEEGVGGAAAAAGQSSLSIADVVINQSVGSVGSVRSS